MASEGTLLRLYVGMMLFGLVIVLLGTIVYQMSLTYPVDSNSIETVTGGAYDKDTYEQDLETINTEGETYRERFFSGAVDDVDDPSGFFSVIQDIGNVIITPFDTVSTIAKTNFNIPTYVTNIFSAILSITIVFATWRALRAGS